MVNLSTRAAVAAAGLLLVGAVTATAANAAPAAGPGSADCLTAQGTVKLRVDAAAAASVNFENAAAKLDDATKAQVALAMDAFDNAKADLDAALAKLKTAPTDANAAAAEQAGVKLVAAANALLDIKGLEPVADAKQVLIDARAALEAALAVQDKACDGDGPTVTATPTPTPSTTPAPDGTFYASCDAVRDAGKAPLGRSEPGYRDALDSDGDGLACEVVEGVPAAPGAVPVPSQIDTGKP